MASFSKIHHDSQKDEQGIPPIQLVFHHLKKLSIPCVIVTVVAILFSLSLPKALIPIMLWLLVVVYLKLKLKLNWSTSSEVHMVDFYCYTPPSFCRVPQATFVEHISMLEAFDEDSVSFVEKLLTSSGQGERTCAPPSLLFIPPRPYHKESLEEAGMLLFPAMEALLSNTKTSPQDVDILIVNCSGFCPSSSLSSIVVNKFRLREDVKTYTISGMGCSASMIAVDMAANLLKVHKNSNAVILSTEILTTGWYSGKERAKLPLNCLFRMGSAAILLTNNKQAKITPKYKLIRSQRTQTASNSRAYRSAFREEDQQGNTGVTFTRDILEVVGEILRTSIIDLASSILPISEKFKYIISLIKMNLLKGRKEKAYVPNFKTVITHFCIPTSGRAIIREIAKGLRLHEEDVEAAMATLHRFGNQSSSSLWYELAYLEAKGRVKKGDKVWQLGLGSGLKATNVVWECMGPISSEPNIGPWADCIDEYPKTAF